MNFSRWVLVPGMVWLFVACDGTNAPPDDASASGATAGARSGGAGSGGRSSDAGHAGGSGRGASTGGNAGDGGESGDPGTADDGGSAGAPETAGLGGNAGKDDTAGEGGDADAGAAAAVGGSVGMSGTSGTSNAAGDSGDGGAPDLACGSPRCGNGILEAFEECDDGNADDEDECTSLCLRPPHFVCPGCERAVCGNGVIEPFPSGGCGGPEIEECDDGNTLPGDGCDPHCLVDRTRVCPAEGGPCRIPVCGDGIEDGGFVRDGQWTGEECEDALRSDCLNCRLVAPCGNFRVEAWGHEQCDDGNQLPGDGCSADCRIEARTWLCPSNGGACTPSVCGDNQLDSERESCDDGNRTSGDGCSSDCELEVCEGGHCRVPRCGDGFRDALAFRGIQSDGDFREEACDDGNQRAGDGCAADCSYVEEGWVCSAPGEDCSRARCGDGVVTYRYEEDGVVRSEDCDDGNDIAGDGCTDCYSPLGCKPLWVREQEPQEPECGNHELDPGERCDDGNSESGDGCVDCDWEPGFACLDFGDGWTCKPSACGNGIIDHWLWNGCTLVGESCDDGNQISGDGCSSRCELEPYFACTEGAPCVPAACGDGRADSYLTLDLGLVSESEDTGTYCRLVGFPHHAVGCRDESYPVECNDHNNTNGDGCSTDCKIEPGPWVCPRTGPPYEECHRAVCGDGNLEGLAEQCDDGNRIDGDGCSADCVSEICDGQTCHLPSCGNGMIENIWHAGHSLLSWIAPEGCDDGDTTNGDGCSDECTVEVGFVCPKAGEPCAPPRCGDGVLSWSHFTDGEWHAETCDDGNDIDCDGCTNCQVDSACHPTFGPRMQL